MFCHHVEEAKPIALIWVSKHYYGLFLLFGPPVKVYAKIQKAG